MGANQSNVPVEMIESDYPIRIERYGLVPDTGGPGRHRGGLSLMREYRILCEEAILSIRSDKRRYPPHGLFGGGTGAPSMNLINPQCENKLLPVLMTEVERLKRGDVYLHIMAGGGGYGDPFDRDPIDVLDDVIEEKVTIKHAEDAYGVVIVADPALRGAAACDGQMRQRRRTFKLRASLSKLPVIGTAERMSVYPERCSEEVKG